MFGALLQVLHRPQCDEDVLLQFVEHFKELEHLEISDCSGLMGRVSYVLSWRYSMQFNEGIL